jgi:hypothetical protein
MLDDTPSGEAARACEVAEARLNELLQQRFTATHRSEPAVDPVAGRAWPTSLAG